MLDKEPGKAEENLVQERRFTVGAHEPSRQLTFKRERDLVDHLAFLSAFRDDADKVIALCVEEHQKPEGLIIRIAMNTGDLEPVKEWLARIVGLLEPVAARRSKSAADESAVFNDHRPQSRSHPLSATVQAREMVQKSSGQTPSCNTAGQSSLCGFFAQGNRMYPK
ncbi:MAG: hypothetical protein M1816_002204 [Peltula sp. TS41687]|nr:MAG: hypothetical protein M1816_002204 [Peltula sp. TS41687]